MNEINVPRALVEVDQIDLDPADEAAVVEALRELAAGRMTTFSSVEEFDAYARQVVAEDGQVLRKIA